MFFDGRLYEQERPTYFSPKMTGPIFYIFSSILKKREIIFTISMYGREEERERADVVFYLPIYKSDSRWIAHKSVRH